MTIPFVYLTIFAALMPVLILQKKFYAKFQTKGE